MSPQAGVPDRAPCIAQPETGRLDTSSAPLAAMTSAPLIATLSPVPRLGLSGSLRRTVSVIGESLVLVGIVCCIPFVILAIGTPIALVVRLLLWVAGVL
jgi:hypothetical protein